MEIDPMIIFQFCCNQAVILHCNFTKYYILYNYLIRHHYVKIKNNNYNVPIFSQLFNLIIIF
jgi:hypothetical protein